MSGDVSQPQRKEGEEDFLYDDEYENIEQSDFEDLPQESFDDKSEDGEVYSLDQEYEHLPTEIVLY